MSFTVSVNFFQFWLCKIELQGKSGAILLHTYHTLYEQYTEYVPFGKNRKSRDAWKNWMKTAAVLCRCCDCSNKEGGTYAQRIWIDRE